MFKKCIIAASLFTSMTSMATEPPFEFQGETVGMGTFPRDGLVDFGVVLPALTSMELMHFDLATIISPEIDWIQIVGNRVGLPSNFTLPDQKESYIFPIRLNKPQYRIRVDLGPQRIVGLHGQFPFRTVAGDSRRGKTLVEMLNHFSFLTAGHHDVEAKGPQEGLEISTDHVELTGEVFVTMPELPIGTEAVSLAFTEQSGYYMPTDLKRVPSGETWKLRVPNINKHYVINQLVNQNGQTNLFASAVSMAVTDDVHTMPRFLDHIDKPFIESGVLKFQPPKPLDGIEPIGTYIVFARVEPAPEETHAPDKRYPIWSTQLNGWAHELVLPFEFSPIVEIFRWEVLFLGRQVGEDSIYETPLLLSATHVSRNHLDLEPTAWRLCELFSQFLFGQRPGISCL